MKKHKYPATSECTCRHESRAWRGLTPDPLFVEKITLPDPNCPDFEEIEEQKS